MHRGPKSTLRFCPKCWDITEKTSDPGSGDGGAVVSLPCWGLRLGVACGQGSGEDGGCRLLCEVQVCGLAKMMTRAEDGSRRGFVSQITQRVRWVLLLSCAAVEPEMRCFRGDDDQPQVVCRVLGRRKTSIIPL
jgi:hypothetical protein